MVKRMHCILSFYLTFSKQELFSNIYFELYNIRSRIHFSFFNFVNSEPTGPNMEKNECLDSSKLNFACKTPRAAVDKQL